MANKRNGGREKAIAAAQAVGGVAAFPQFDTDAEATTGRTDWNDLHAEQGLDAVAQQLRSAIESADARSVSMGDEPPPAESVPPGPPDAAYADDLAQGDHRYDPSDGDWFSRLTRNREHKIENHASNLDLIFEHDARWAEVLAYCDFSYRVLFLRQPPIAHADPELQDPDIANMRIWFARHYESMRPPPRNELQDAIIAASHRQRHHPVQSYLQSLRPAAGERRLDAWLCSAFDAGDDERYLRLVGRKYLIGAVARVMRPGCKMDNMLILEGAQGKRKSTGLSILFGDWFSDAPIPLGDKDAHQLIQGVWGYELQELDALNKVESTTAKSFLTLNVDRFRMPYGTTVMSFKRQTVFCGTTNKTEYLKDATGARRFWPVRVRNVDTQWLTLWRDQLWGEAYAAYQAGEPWWIEDDEQRQLCEEAQEKRRHNDTWEDAIADYVGRVTRNHFTAHELLIDAVGLDGAKSIQRVHENRVSDIMRALGWDKDRVSHHGKRRHVYVRPEADRVADDSQERVPF